MKRTKLEKGITLIALIITIIVLLILAVVAIGAVNNTGIIQYAQNSADEYGRGQEKENTTLQGYIDILNDYNPNKKDSNVPDKLVKYLFGDNSDGRPFLTDLSEDGINYKENKELGIAAGDVKGLKVEPLAYEGYIYMLYIEYNGIKYKFKVGVDIDTGGMPQNTIPSYGVVKIYDPNQETRVGKYVEDEQGNKWIIIYDNDTHGLQMVSADTFKYNNSEFYLGYNNTLITDWTTLDTTTPEFKLADLNKDGKLEDSENLERAIYSYNQAVETLNIACENLFKQNGNYSKTYIQDVRCVGSNPIFANKNSENTKVCTSEEIPLLATLPKNNENQVPGLCNGKGYSTDNNYEADYDRLAALKINNLDESYWLASRNIDHVLDYSSDVTESERNTIYFNIYRYSTDGYVHGDDIVVITDSEIYGIGGDSCNNDLRPVILLDSNIQFSEGDGTEEEPYKF